MEVKLVIPDSLEEVTLGQYQEYLDFANKFDEVEDAEVINKKLIEVFCGVKYDLVDHIPIRDIESVLKVLKTAFEKEYSLSTRFKLDNVDMGFIPKLDDMSLGEYIDCENYITDWSNMHKAMSVLYRPVNFAKGDKYTISRYSPNDDIAELMKGMPLSVVMGALVFFYRLGTELSAATLIYMEKAMKKDTSSALRMALEESGVGISQFMLSLKEMSEDLMKLPPFQYTSVLPS